MKLGKYDITVESKAVNSALINYAAVLTLIILFTENTSKQSFYIAFCSGIAQLVWNIFWFNFYKNKKLNNKQNVEGVFSSTQ